MKKENGATLLISDEIEMNLNEQTKIKIELQVIFNKKDLDKPFELDIIDHINTNIYYLGNKLNYVVGNDNCPYKNFLKFNESIGIDISMLVDEKIEDWEKTNKQNGYFDKLLFLATTYTTSSELPTS